MKTWQLRYLPQAEDDIAAILDWIADKVGLSVAMAYADRLEAHIDTLRLVPHIGSVRADIHPGLRAIGFERSLTIVFLVTAEGAVILGVFVGGQNWEDKMAERLLPE